MNVHRSDLVVHPAHSLQRRIVITQLKLTTRHVLLLKDGHARLPVVLCKKRRGKKWFRISSSTNSGTLPRCESQTYGAADGPEGDHPFNAVGVAATVGLDAGVVSLLQHKLLPAEAGVLIAHPAAKEKKVLVNDITAVARLGENISGYIRSTLDLQRTDVLHPTLHDVLAAGGELHTPSLEVLLVVHGDLRKQVKSVQVRLKTQSKTFRSQRWRNYRSSVLPSKVP